MRNHIAQKTILLPLAMLIMIGITFTLSGCGLPTGDESAEESASTAASTEAAASGPTSLTTIEEIEQFYGIQIITDQSWDSDHVIEVFNQLGTTLPRGLLNYLIDQAPCGQAVTLFSFVESVDDTDASLKTDDGVCFVVSVGQDPHESLIHQIGELLLIYLEEAGKDIPSAFAEINDEVSYLGGELDSSDSLPEEYQRVFINARATQNYAQDFIVSFGFAHRHPFHLYDGANYEQYTKEAFRDLSSPLAKKIELTRELSHIGPVKPGEIIAPSVP